MELHERIAVIRKAMGLTQEQLGELVGVSRQAVSKWESGQTVPDALTVAKLCQALNVSADYVLLGKEPEDTAGEASMPVYEPPEECPVCGRSAEGNVCTACGYTIPMSPPKGSRYAVVATGGWLTSDQEETAEQELIKHCGFTPGYAKACRQKVGSFGRLVVRRDLDDRAAQWLTGQLSRELFAPKIVEDCGEEDEALLEKAQAMELPPPEKKNDGLGFWGVVGAVVVALLIVSFF